MARLPDTVVAACSALHWPHNSFKKYALRLLAFAVISHFAYNFAFGIPFIPFTTTAFNQTSVIWSLFWGLILLKVNGSDKLATWQKISIILELHSNHGDTLHRNLPGQL